MWDKHEHRITTTPTFMSIQNYTIGKCLGSGSFADVYVCQEKKSLKIYAAKIKKKEGEYEESQTYQKLQGVPHYGIPLLHETFIEGNKEHIIFEFIQGETLFNYISFKAKQTHFVPVVPEDVIQHITRQVLYTLRFIHQHGIAHQDIKTDNIFLQDNGRIVIIDFSESYNLEAIQEDKTNNADQKVGNLIFLPPEIFQDQISVKTQSLINLEKLAYDSQQMGMCLTALKKHNRISHTRIDPTEESVINKKNYRFTHLHYIQAVMPNFIIKKNRWIKALERMYIFGRNYEHIYDDDNTARPNYESIDLPSDGYPSADDLVLVAQVFCLKQLKAELLYKLNQRFAADSWAVGIVMMIMLLGQRPFNDLNIYESAAAISVLAEGIKIQLEETLDQIKGENEDFAEYNQQKDHSIYKIPEGPLPQETPIDLFLLIAGLLHPHPKIRLAISEALECPFLRQRKRGQFPNNYNIMNVNQKNTYEEVSTSLSRLNLVKDGPLSLPRTINDNAPQSNLQDTNDMDYIIDDSDEPLDDDY